MLAGMPYWPIYRKMPMEIVPFKMSAPICAHTHSNALCSLQCCASARSTRLIWLLWFNQSNIGILQVVFERHQSVLVARRCISTWSMREEYTECNEYQRLRKAADFTRVRYQWPFSHSLLRYNKVKIFHIVFKYSHPIRKYSKSRKYSLIGNCKL